MVGVPCRPEAAAAAAAGGINATRLTWLMNLDFKGLVPVLVVKSALMTSACYPRLNLLDLEKKSLEKKKAGHAETVTKLRKRLGREDEELREKGDEIDDKRSREAELARLLAEKDSENEKMKAELREKDEEHASAIARKDEEIASLRRRLPSPRAVQEE